MSTATTTLKEELMQIEMLFWERPHEAKTFQENMADDGIAIFGTHGFVDKATAIEMSKEGTEWRKPTFRYVRVFELGNDCAVLVYLAETLKKGSDGPYGAFASSVYRKKSGKWQLTVHHQTEKA